MLSGSNKTTVGGGVVADLDRDIGGGLSCVGDVDCESRDSVF